MVAKGEGGVKNIKNWVTSFMDGPKVNNWSLRKANKTVIVLEIVKVH